MLNINFKSWKLSFIRKRNGEESAEQVQNEVRPHERPRTSTCTVNSYSYLPGEKYLCKGYFKVCNANTQATRILVLPKSRSVNYYLFALISTTFKPSTGIPTKSNYKLTSNLLVRSLQATLIRGRIKLRKIWRKVTFYKHFNKLKSKSKTDHNRSETGQRFVSPSPRLGAQVLVLVLLKDSNEHQSSLLCKSINPALYCNTEQCFILTKVSL